MSFICLKCKLDIDQRDGQFFQCDSCKRPIHSNYSCSELSASEIKCMTLKKRMLRFLCDDCNNGLLQIPTILHHIEELRDEVNSLKKEAQKHSENYTDKLPNVNGFETETVIAEMFDRQRRASNIIIANMVEGAVSDESSSYIHNNDLQAVKDLLRDFNVNVNNIKVFRLGRRNQQRPRLIKVVMSNSEDALTVLKSKTTIKVSNIKIFGDQTVSQRDYFKTVKNELQRLITNGDNSKTIRYINNKPTIVPRENTKN